MSLTLKSLMLPTNFASFESSAASAPTTRLDSAVTLLRVRDAWHCAVQRFAETLAVTEEPSNNTPTGCQLKSLNVPGCSIWHESVHVSWSLPETRDNVQALDCETRTPSGTLVWKLNEIFDELGGTGTVINDVPSNPKVVLSLHSLPAYPSAHVHV